MNTKRFLSRSEASDYLVGRGLRIAKQTLAKFAVTGEGRRIGLSEHGSCTTPRTSMRGLSRG